MRQIPYPYTMNSTEYWNEIAELAKAYNDDEYRAQDYGSEGDRDEWLWETLDGHQYVIYTGMAREVLAHSENPSAIVDEGLADVVDYLNPEPAAMMAMMADVREWGA